MKPGRVLGWLAALAALAVAVICVVVVVGAANDNGTSSPATSAKPKRQDLVVDIPKGTKARLTAGERLDLLPLQLRLGVGSTLTLANHDDAEHVVGPYTVSAGQTVTQSFPTPIRFQGFCTLNSEAQVMVIVE